MAATIKTTFKLNGSRKFIAFVQITGDAGGDLTSQAILDSKAAITDIQATVGMTGLPTLWKIESIDWELTGFAANLIWSGNTPAQACALPQYDGRIDFLQNGAPLTNNATTPDGKLLITTNGLAANKYGTIVIKGYHK